MHFFVVLTTCISSCRNSSRDGFYFVPPPQYIYSKRETTNGEIKFIFDSLYIFVENNCGQHQSFLAEIEFGWRIFPVKINFWRTVPRAKYRYMQESFAANSMDCLAIYTDSGEHENFGEISSLPECEQRGSVFTLVLSNNSKRGTYSHYTALVIFHIPLQFEVIEGNLSVPLNSQFPLRIVEYRI